MRLPQQCALLLVLSPLLLSAELVIEVRDPAGEPMQATATLASLAPGVHLSLRTNPSGILLAHDLPAGRYRLTIAAPGFSIHVQTVDASQDTPTPITVRMSILPLQQHSLDVIEPLPLSGLNLLRQEVAGAVQTGTQAALEQSGAIDLSSFLNLRLNAVHINDIQGNPFQQDVSYRGFTASPLLGTPQGLSVYVDGVRVNQPFGDVVSWDLIPRIAIADVTLMPGSNPVFGLNTLGGALSVQTKDGNLQPGASISLTGGSSGRKIAELEHGGANRRGLSWYLASSLFFEDGWRQASPSNVRQFFAKIGLQREKNAFHLSAGYANNLLSGNGLQEQRFLQQNYSSVYNKPDNTKNRSAFLTLSATHAPSSKLTLSENIYYRDIRTRSFNADLNEGSLDEAVYQPTAADIAALKAAGYSGFPTAGANAANTPYPFWRCIAQALQHDETVEKCNGLLTRANSQQQNYGASAQATWHGSLHGQRNQLTFGAAFDRSTAGFTQSQQFAYLNPDHTFTAVDAFADGTTNSNGTPYDTRVNLHGQIHTESIYAADALSLGKRITLTLSGRFNHTVVDDLDRLHPAATAGSLSSSNQFTRFNSAAGISVRASSALNLYASYGEGSRAPTAIELGCADPNRPCKLPNAMAGDPPLRQVVTRTFEAGLRGGEESVLNWSAAWFRAQNHDDILFVSSTQTGYGYFKNFGQTRRQGLELQAQRKFWRLTPSLNYTLLQATYQSPETIGASGNSSNDSSPVAKGLDGDIAIRPGDRLPLSPRHMGKAYLDLELSKKLVANISLVAVSSSLARGNENNLHRADGLYYLGPGQAPGYAVFHASARYRITHRVELFVQANNLFDRHYYSAAQLGVTGYTANNAFIARPFPAVQGNYPLVHTTFLAPGAPRAAWLGLRFRF